MSQVISQQLFSWAIYAVSMFIICLVTIRKAGMLGRFCVNGVMGASIIFIINCVLYKFSLCLGINLLTVLISSILGVPGIGLMYLMLYIL